MGNKTLNASSGIGSHLEKIFEGASHSRSSATAVHDCDRFSFNTEIPDSSELAKPLYSAGLQYGRGSSASFWQFCPAALIWIIGSVMAVSSVFCASLLMMTNNILVAILGALVICAVLGTVNGLIVAKLRVAPFIVTLGMMEFARGIAYWYTNPAPISWKNAECAGTFSFHR